MSGNGSGSGSCSNRIITDLLSTNKAHALVFHPHPHLHPHLIPIPSSYRISVWALSLLSQAGHLFSRTMPTIILQLLSCRRCVIMRGFGFRLRLPTQDERFQDICCPEVASKMARPITSWSSLLFCHLCPSLFPTSSPLGQPLIGNHKMVTPPFPLRPDLSGIMPGLTSCRWSIP